MGPWILAGLFIFVGGIFAALGWSNLKSMKRKRATWIAAQGTVVGLSEVHGSGGRTLYAPVYHYYFNNSEHSTTSDTASAPPAYKEGDPIQLLVNPMNGDESQVIDRTVSLLTYVMTAIGALAFAIGILVAWLAATGQFKLE